mmetsp:Transcript_29923/g.41087  ORF Transcript_29923/g.41087 Transcript_29923/m.41087 type:complete len:444 (+) Transcript_29923:111-1442(+)
MWRRIIFRIAMVSAILQVLIAEKNIPNGNIGWSSVLENIAEVTLPKIRKIVIEKNSLFNPAHRPDLNQIGRTHPEFSHKVVIAVRQLNLDQLDELVHDISDPDSKNYGKHQSMAEIQAMTANTESTNFIIAYLRRTWPHGHFTMKTSEYGDFITVTAKISMWEDFLDTQFYEYQQKLGAESITLHRSLGYSLPEDLVEHVHSVFLTSDLPPKVSGKPAVQTTSPSTLSKVSTEGRINGYVTPALLNSYYSIPSNQGSTSVSQTVFAAIGQTLSPTDLTKFQTKFLLPLQSISANSGAHVSDTACATNVDDCAEANLDVQYMMAVSQNTPTIYYYWDGISSDLWVSFLVDFVSHINFTANTPQVISISYVSPESQFSSAYFHSFTAQAMKLAAAGVTIIAASGDDGANCHAGFCASTPSCGYSTLFPASNPFVTAVGATQVDVH